MKKEFIDAHKRILPFIHQTPIHRSHLLEDIAGCRLFFKCENFQRMGAFKMRGALNAIMQLSEAEQSCGVVTHSSGNFAQALSLAAKSLGVKAYVVMPKNAPKIKKQAVQEYGGNIIESDNTLLAREEQAQKIVERIGATFIHPSNDMNVILGQGTVAKEMLELHPGLDYIFSPVGGGGLVAGTILATQHFSTACKVIGGEPRNVDDAFRSLESGKIESNSGGDTIADGLKTQLGTENFPIIHQGIDCIIRVEESEIISAMRLIWERMKLIVEPSAAVPFAALLKDKQAYIGKDVGVILSGGNVDLDMLPFNRD